MPEKYIFALMGIIIGSFLSALFSVIRELYAERRLKRKEAEYLAIRMVCIFDSFMEGCVPVIRDDGLYHGQPDADGYSTIQVATPQLDVQLENVNWKSFPPELMYEILYFPNYIKNSESCISNTYEYGSSPPDYSEAFEERQYQYSNLGLMAFKLSEKLREKYKIPKNHISSWGIVEYINGKISEIDDRRLKQEKANKAMLASLNE